LKAREDQLFEHVMRQFNKLIFFQLKLSRLNRQAQRKLLMAEVLKNYRHLLEKIFLFAPHRLSEGEEGLFNLLSNPALNSWVRFRSDLVSREERLVLTNSGKKEKKIVSQLSPLVRSSKKKVRDSAAQAAYDIYKKNSDVAEAELNAVLLTKKIEDQARNFIRPDRSRHLTDDISTEIVDSLVRAVSSRFDVPARYYNLKRKLLGLKQLESYERSVLHGSVDDKYTFEEGVRIIRTVLNSLDPEFSHIFNSYLIKGQIDVFPRKEKRGGGFCTEQSLLEPTFILMNWNDMLSDIRTLAHEMGHAIHSELMREQKAVFYDVSTATAEVSSTFIENFVVEHLLKNAEDEQKLILLIQRIEEDVGTIFEQIKLYNFEQELHETFRAQGYLSKDKISNIFVKHLTVDYGKAVKRTPGSEHSWVNWPHIRMFFYVYSYASGKLISKVLQKRVRENPAAIEDVKKFMAAGTSDTPENIFKSIGIDITKKSFWEEGLNEVEEQYNEIYALAKKLKKI